jgi:hypothetical protein
MCEDSKNPVKLLVLTSISQLLSGTKCCSVNNGKPHVHCIKAENQRHEKIHIKGTVSTRSGSGQLSFTLASTPQWDVDFFAYGQRVKNETAPARKLRHLAGEFAGTQNAENSFISIRDPHEFDAACEDDKDAMVGGSLIEEDLVRFYLSPRAGCRKL